MPKTRFGEIPPSGLNFGRHGLQRQPLREADGSELGAEDIELFAFDLDGFSWWHCPRLVEFYLLIPSLIEDMPIGHEARNSRIHHHRYFGLCRTRHHR